MNRAFKVSLAVHALLIAMIWGLGWVPKPDRTKPPDFTISFVPPAPRGAPPTPIPAPPRPPEPKPPPKEVPIKKKPDSAKKIIKETKEVLDKPTPPPTPEPTPEATPEKTPKPKETTKTVKETPKSTPGPTPQPTVDLSKMDMGTPVPDALPGTPLPPQVVTIPGGALQSDATQWVLGPNYAQQALWRIQQNFRPPYSLEASCEVAFRILKDGTIDKGSIRITRSSGRPDLDQAAIRALNDTEKLPELYASYKKPFLDVKVTFDYMQEF